MFIILILVGICDEYSISMNMTHEFR